MTAWIASLRKLISTGKRSSRPIDQRLRPALELLEDRFAPATLSVNSNLDNTTADSVLTLREAIEVVDGTLGRALTAGEKARISGPALGVSDTIVFIPGMSGKTISLTTGDELDVNKSLRIIGPGASYLSIAGVTERIFSVDGGPGGHPIFTIQGVTLKNGLCEYGGAVANENAATSNIISCVITGNGVDNVGGAIANDYSGGAGGHVLIQGCLITGNHSDRAGGAVYNAGVMKIQSCTMSGNITGDDGGGAVYNAFTGNLTAIGVTFNGFNATTGNGGAIRSYGNSLIQNCTISGNIAQDKGGGIVNENPDGMTIQNTVISGNFATDGGGIANGPDAELKITNSTISKNTAASYGGGLYDAYGSVTMLDCTVSGNQAGASGGGISNYSGNLNIQRSTISGNTASDNGGGIENYINSPDTKQTLLNCTISGNTANSRGGGIFTSYYYSEGHGDSVEHEGEVRPESASTYAPTLTAINCTIAFNTAKEAGGGMYANTGAVNVFNTILSDNKGPGGVLNDLAASSTDLINAQFCLVQTPNGVLAPGSAHNITGVSAQLGPLTNNGGPTLTHRPALTSPVLQKGSTALLTPDMTTDQRGGPRTYLGTVDIGAVEVLPKYVVRRGWGNFFVY